MNRFSTLAGSAALAGIATMAMAQAAAPAEVRNVVLVHGAFVDGSGWNAVASILRKDGYKVSIVQEPETSLVDDVAATTRIIERQDGPVVLVGHSYGGVVITEAGRHPLVKALVYVAAFQPDEGESLAKLGASKPPAGSPLVPSKDGFLFIDQTTFRADFAADLPTAQTDLMAVSQLPLSVRAATAEVGSPAWKVKPTYAIVANQDRSINPDLERFMYKRSNSMTTEIGASHAVYISQPEAVAKVIEQAANAQH